MTRTLLLPLVLATQLASAAPILSTDALLSVEGAILDAGRNQRPKAVARLESLLMTQGVTFGMEAPGAMTNAVQDGVDAWKTELPNVPLRLVESKKPDVTVKFVHSIPEGTDTMGMLKMVREYQWGNLSHRYRIRGAILVRDNVDGRPIRREEVSSVVAHEIGHMFGLGDELFPGDLMGPFVPRTPALGPSLAEIGKVRAFRQWVQSTLAAVQPAHTFRGLRRSKGSA